jgi:hypothetical protein
VRTERGWLVPTVVIVLVAAALIVAGVLVAGGGGGLPKIGGGNDNGPTAANAITITSAKAFDPFGDGAENDADAPKAIDGDPATFWRTEGYNNPAIQTKPGVGLYVTLGGSATLKSLKVTSPSNLWAAEIYVADGPKPDLAGWGQPVTHKDNIPSGSVTFDLGGAKGAAVLIWFTNLGDGSGDAGGNTHGRIAEVSVGQG